MSISRIHSTLCYFPRRHGILGYCFEFTGVLIISLQFLLSGTLADGRSALNDSSNTAVNGSIDRKTLLKLTDAPWADEGTSRIGELLEKQFGTLKAGVPQHYQALLANNVNNRLRELSSTVENYQLPEYKKAYTEKTLVELANLLFLQQARVLPDEHAQQEINRQYDELLLQLQTVADEHLKHDEHKAIDSRADRDGGVNEAGAAEKKSEDSGHSSEGHGATSTGDPITSDNGVTSAASTLLQLMKDDLYRLRDDFFSPAFAEQLESADKNAIGKILRDGIERFYNARNAPEQANGLSDHDLFVRSPRNLANRIAMDTAFSLRRHFIAMPKKSEGEIAPIPLDQSSAWAEEYKKDLDRIGPAMAKYEQREVEASQQAFEAQIADKRRAGKYDSPESVAERKELKEQMEKKHGPFPQRLPFQIEAPQDSLPDSNTTDEVAGLSTRSMLIALNVVVILVIVVFVYVRRTQ